MTGHPALHGMKGAPGMWDFQSRHGEELVILLGGWADGSLCHFHSHQMQTKQLWGFSSLFFILVKHK